jgi:hypothetical protein
MMKPSTQDRTEDKLHEEKMKIKEELGKTTNKWIGCAEKAVGE